jgi:ubiquinone biosynthesis monooxygenase Coq7
MSNDSSLVLGPKYKGHYLHQAIRVNQAGEYGATCIYAGQQKVLGQDFQLGPVLKHMADQEKVHLDKFNQIMVKNQVRPTIMSPVWGLLGFGLGYITAKMSKQAAMACTVAVEEVIEEHYQEQIETLVSQNMPEDTEILELIKQCQSDEIDHKDQAIDLGAKGTPGYEMLTSLIKGGVKTAIWISKKI